MNIVITGTSLGLGRELAKKLTAQGNNVYGCSRGEVDEALYGPTYHHKPTDITVDESVREFAKWVESQVDSVDILINCAGVLNRGNDGLIVDLDIDSILETVNTNALGPLRVSKYVLPLVLKGKELLIVNISSEAGTIKGDNYYNQMFGYCMSKAALNKEGLLLQRYVKSLGVDVLMVHPGWMLTRMGGDDAPLDPAVSADGILDLIENRTPEMFADYKLYDYRGKVLNW